MDMAVEARYSHVPLTAKERGLFLVNAHFLPTTKKLIIIRNSRKGRPRNGCGVHHLTLINKSQFRQCQLIAVVQRGKFQEGEVETRTIVLSFVLVARKRESVITKFFNAFDY